MDVARALFERALAIFERVLGPDHPHTAASRRWLLAAEADRQADATEKGPLPGGPRTVRSAPATPGHTLPPPPKPQPSGYFSGAS
jgi:Tetratricopeptide repeat